jgi:hypothetical protein
MAHEIAYQAPVLVDALGAITVTGACCLNYSAIVSHDILETNETVVKEGEILGIVFYL